MNIANRLVSAALRSSQGIRPFMTAGLDQAWLKSDEGRAVFKDQDRLAYAQMLELYQEHRYLDEALFREVHRSPYKLDKGDWPAKVIIAEVRKVIQRRLLNEAFNLVEDADEDLEGTLAEFLHLADRLRSGILVADQDNIERVQVDDMDAFIDDKVEMGIPFGIKDIDDAYLGGQPGQLITFVGRQKSTKSTLMAYSSIAAWVAGYEQIFYNVELDSQFMKQKLFSIGGKVSPTRLRHGGLSSGERRKLHDFNDRLQRDGINYYLAQKFSRFTAADVAREVDTYHPHCIYIDGFYFMEDQNGDSASSDHKAIENVAASLKALAMEKQITIYVSTQAQEKQQGKTKGRGIEARTIQGGTGLLKASDLVLGVDKDDAGNVTLNQIYNRYGDIPDITFKWNWEVMDIDMVDIDQDLFQ